MYTSPYIRVQQIGLIVVIALLLLYAGLSYVGLQETRDAKRVEAVQVSLQEALSKGMATLQVAPNDIEPENIVNAAHSRFPQNTMVDPTLRLTFRDSNRQAIYQVTLQGDVVIATLTNFNRYCLENGRIKRDSGWTLPLPMRPALSP